MSITAFMRTIGYRSKGVFDRMFATPTNGRLVYDAPSCEDGPILVVVHGTWARGAAWTRRDSPLLAALLTTWATFRLCRFEWSGKNGARDRLSASMNLARELEDIHKRYPDSPIVTLAHSHGGNIVAWASTIITFRLSAAIYLNTPFIQVLATSNHAGPGAYKPAHIRPNLGFVGISLYGVTVLCGVFAAKNPVAHLVNFSDWSAGYQIAVMLALVALASLPATWLINTLPNYIESIARSLNDLSTGARKIEKELVVYAVGDEAATALTAVYFWQWLTDKLALVFVLAFFAGVLIPWQRLAAYGESYIPFVVLFFPAIAVLYAALLIVAGTAHGPLQALINLDSPVTVTPAPVGEAHIVTVGWKTKDRLRHSKAHDDLSVAASISEWLKTTANIMPRTVRAARAPER